MEKLFEGKVYEILPTSNGIIFSYQNKEMNDGNVVVSYKMISFDSRRITDVAKNVYMITKFGNGYKAVEPLCENYITVKALILPGGKVFLLHKDGTAQLVDSDGEPLWTGNFIYRNMVPTDIILHKEGLWAAFPEANAILKYSLLTMKQELRIGGKSSPFDGPCHLFEEDGRLMICNRASSKLLSLDTDDYSLLEYESFEEALFDYANISGYRFIVLESGLYII